MSSFTILCNLLLSDIRTTLISLIIGFIAYKLSRFYYQVYSLPPGPIPLPLVGNMLKFRGIKHHWSLEMERMAKQFGPVMTLWLGSIPQVFINDIELSREVFLSNNFAGRPKFSSQLLNNEKRTDIVFADYGHAWEALRRVAHSAVIKYTKTEKLNDLAIDCVDHTINTMIEREGFDQPFAPFEYIYNMFLNIMAASAFGKRYELDDPEYKLTKYIQKDFQKEHGMRTIFWETIPGFKFIDPKFHKFKKIFQKFLDMITDKYESHYKDYDESVIRDFCDTLITAKNEALREGKESAPYLTDENLALCIFDLFAAGTDTSQSTFRWIVFHMFFNRDIEKKLRKEVNSQIGDRIPTYDDRNLCQYCMAFLSEVLRHSNIVPVGVPHKAMVTSKIGNHTIQEGTQLVAYQGYILHQEQHWKDPYEFIPERFLDSDGKYLTTRHKAFIPFGVGRRVCLGEKLAIADLFLVLVRFLQKTSQYEVAFHMKLADHPLYPDPNMLEHHPNSFEISFGKK